MFTTGTYLNWKARTAILQSNPAIWNNQGKQKLVQYSEGSLHPSIHLGKSNQKEMKNRSI